MVTNPVGIYLLKVNNRNTTARYETYFTPCSSVSAINFEHVIADWEIFAGKSSWSLMKKLAFALFSCFLGNLTEN